MIEQELASIIMFVLAASGNPTPYYWNVPEDFVFPAVFFPTPEIDSSGETFRTYRLDYVWYLKFFHTTTQAAHKIARDALEAIKKARNLIPLIDEDGEYLTEGIRGIRLAEVALKPIDDGVVQLTIRFASRRPYDAPDSELMQHWISTITDKTDGTEIVVDNDEEDGTEEDE